MGDFEIVDTALNSKLKLNKRYVVEVLDPPAKVLYGGQAPGTMAQIPQLITKKIKKYFLTL